MSLNNLSVVKKVVLAFALVLAATVALGSISLLRLASVKSAGDQVYVHGLPSASALAEVQLWVSRYRIRQTASIIPGFAVKNKTAEQSVAEMERKVEEALSKSRSRAIDADEIAAADRIEAVWHKYSALNKTLFAINQAEGSSAAVKYLFGPMGDVYQSLVDECKRDISYNAIKMGGQFAYAQQAYDVAQTLIVAFLAIAAGLALLSGFWLVRSVSFPLNKLTEVVSRLAGGHRDVVVPHAEQQDEIGKLAGSILSFNRQLIDAERAKEQQTKQIVESIGTGLAQLAKGDLTHRVQAKLSGEFTQLKEDFNNALDRLEDTMRNVLATTHQLAMGASEISNAADDLSRRTEQQAASLEETAAALEEITVTVKKTSSNAQAAAEGASATKTAAEEGGRVVETAVKAMDAIAQSSKQITDITGVIDEIAFQTNLLALNAGVEAARAGDAGRGFAVVASEVRALAQRSSEAAKQIKALINTSSAYVAEGVKYVGESGGALTRIVEQVVHINSLVVAMSQAAQQQATGIEEVNAAVGQMDQVTQQNAAMVEESTAASRNLADETQNLTELVGFFSVDDTAVSTTPRTLAVLSPTATRPTKRPQVHPARAEPAAARSLRQVNGVKRMPSEDRNSDWAEF